ncbi:uncharacterized protein [Halyomorpha halys]|uniref:uncharacterized protein n=1 Tax=Halyomorpha halys TaxID=286706 RepID=UPI0006D50D96|nr:uncharacterized protein LOC106678296 [Halyomorpha halys]
MSYCPSVADSEIASFRPSVLGDKDDCDEVRTFLQFSAKNVGNEKLSLLIISTQKFCEKIKTFIFEIISQKYNKSIFIKSAENIEQILESGLSFTTIDYIVVIFDTSLRSNVQKLMKELQQVENSYIATRRLSLVNGSPKDGIKGTDLEIAELAQQYNLLYLSGQVMNNDSCKKLCERILELATTSCGFNGGVPFIIPTAMDVFRQLFI